MLTAAAAASATSLAALNACTLHHSNHFPILNYPGQIHSQVEDDGYSASEDRRPLGRLRRSLRLLRRGTRFKALRRALPSALKVGEQAPF